MGLFLAISALVLMSALAAVLMYFASLESSASGRQRSSISAHYAAQAGLEEGTARMLPYHPQGFAKMTPPVTLPKTLGQVVYITNPAPGEVVNPTNLSSSNPYADNEYQTEFGVPITSASVAPFVSSFQGSLTTAAYMPYKWVRFTLKTEQSANATISGDAVPNNTIPVYYDGKRQNLNLQGAPVYRVTSLAVVPGGARRMLQLDISGGGGSFNYALAAGGTCELAPSSASTYVFNGNVLCNSGLQVNGTLTMPSGNLSTSGSISGASGSLKFTGSGQQVSGSMSGSGGPPVTGAAVTPTTATPFVSPATPTSNPLPPNTLPNPDPASMLPTVTQTNPLGQCVNGNLVFNLGNANPPAVYQFTGASYTTACGTSFNPTQIPANVQFAGQGTIWFSGPPSGTISFYNDFGTTTTPINLNVIARPLNPATVGNVELEFRGAVNNFQGLLYSQGTVEAEGPLGGNGSCGQYTFDVSGAIIAFGGGSTSSGSGGGNKGGGGGGGNGGGGGGNGNGGIVRAEHCIVMDATYNPNQFGVNPPPGFGGVFGTSIVTTATLNWHGVSF
jgi:hypothetical protein